MAHFIHLVVILSLCCTFALCVDKPQSCILQQKSLQEFLKEAGISSSKVNNFTALFKSKKVDAHVLKVLTLAQLQSLGITIAEDRLKIQKYFAGDLCNNCAKPNICHNGGVCRDGFRCFRCSCPDTFYGPTCSIKCPCQNYGKCLGKAGGFTCKCLAGYKGTVCEKQWLSEKTFNELQEKLTKIKEQSNKKIAKLNAKLSHLRKHGWRLVRVDQTLNSLTSLSLSSKTPTIYQKMPITFPKNTRAIIISVYTYFGNSGSYHAYLDFKAYQQGNAKEGKVKVQNRHYRAYHNTWYYEIMLPWNTTLPQYLIFKVTYSYRSGGSSNYYTVKLAGYVTA